MLDGVGGKGEPVFVMAHHYGGNGLGLAAVVGPSARQPKKNIQYLNYFFSISVEVILK